MPDTVGINKYANCVELKPKWSTINIGLDKTYKKNPEKFEIVHVYRYEGNSDPGDEAVVYGIKSISGKKGVYVAGFSADSDQETVKFLSDLSIKGR